VTPAKIEHLLNAARHYLQTNFSDDCDWRVDVIAILGRPNQPGTEIEWFQNAVS
jgi:Holliday junction resolvase-like predicted endonuclease